ncbi:MAG: transglutaminase-like domain-containing protein [Candidatus Doudnabacteria bacterium]|jgi:transglutaminase-like putative cysteine protease
MEIVDNQPISARFFGEGRWLTEFITPNNLDVTQLYNQITNGAFDRIERITRLRGWVTDKIKYKPFISGTLRIENNVQTNRDVWMDSALTIRTRVGNCANKAFLLASLLRRELSDTEVFCVFGNLYNSPNSDQAGGHAWVQVLYDDNFYILESTTKKVPPMVLAERATRYEAVHLFNDQRVYVVPGRTALQPFSAVYSQWLENYLDYAYIEGNK